MEEGNPFINPESPLLAFKQMDGSSDCTPFSTPGIKLPYTGPIAEVIMVVSDLYATWRPPFRVGK